MVTIDIIIYGYSTLKIPWYHIYVYSMKGLVTFVITDISTKACHKKSSRQLQCQLRFRWSNKHLLVEQYKWPRKLAGLVREDTIVCQVFCLNIGHRSQHGGNKQVDNGVIKADCKKHQRRHCINSDQHLPKGAVWTLRDGVNRHPLIIYSAHLGRSRISEKVGQVEIFDVQMFLVGLK